MNRRSFLRTTGAGIVSLPFIGINAVTSLGKTKPTPLPTIVNGRRVNVDALNELAERVNALTEAAS